MNRRRYIVSALGLLALTAGAAAGRGAAISRAQEASACRVTTHKSAAPPVIDLGQAVTVTLSLSAECPPEEAPVDVALVIDVSASMGNDNKLENAQLAAHAFIDVMALEQSRVGLVTFNHRAGVRSPLVGREGEEQVRDAIDGLIAGGQTNISAAIDVARDLLVSGDRGDAQAMVVLSDGYNTVAGAEPVPAAADRAKAADITIATICAGGACDPDLAVAASTPAMYYNVPDTSLLPDLYRLLASSLQANDIASVTIRDLIPDNMRYVEGSASPPPARVGRPPGAFLEWDFAGMPAGAVTYRLVPGEPGTHPTNVAASARFVDRRSRTGEEPFPVPSVQVIAPPCVERGLDAYFLIDDSNCLAGAVLNDMPSILAIQKGVERMLDSMSLGRDRAAVVAFGDTAVLLQPLTADRKAILDAVLLVAMRDDNARLDLAYRKVRAEQQGGLARPRAQVITVFVTDGPIMPSLEMAEQEARLLRSHGVLHYGIGIGDLAQHGSLRTICEAGGYFETDFGGDVIGTYSRIGAIVAPFGKQCLPLDAATPTVVPRHTATPTRPPVVGPYRRYLPDVRR